MYVLYNIYNIYTVLPLEKQWGTHTGQQASQLCNKLCKNLILQNDKVATVIIITTVACSNNLQGTLKGMTVRLDSSLLVLYMVQLQTAHNVYSSDNSETTWQIKARKASTMLESEDDESMETDVTCQTGN